MQCRRPHLTEVDDLPGDKKGMDTGRMRCCGPFEYAGKTDSHVVSRLSELDDPCVKEKEMETGRAGSTAEMIVNL